MMKYKYDGKFSGNILVVGQTGCGKTTFVQKLAINNMLGNLKEVEQILKIELSKDKEDIGLWFKDSQVKRHYPSDIFESEKII